MFFLLQGLAPSRLFSLRHRFVRSVYSDAFPIKYDEKCPIVTLGIFFLPFSATVTETEFRQYVTVKRTQNFGARKPLYLPGSSKIRYASSNHRRKALQETLVLLKDSSPSVFVLYFKEKLAEFTGACSVCISDSAVFLT